jgi:succinoglycan biosynthesis protein ExoA
MIGSASQDLPFVTVVIPTLNEERSIRPLLESLGCVDKDGRVGSCYSGPHEVFVVDGGSSDRTVEIVGALPAEVGIRVLLNEGKIQAIAVNRAAMTAAPESEYLIRVDAHATYVDGFVDKVVAALIETGADSVVVPLISTASVDAPPFAQAVAAAQRSTLGNGGSAHRLATPTAKWVDHGHHAGFKLSRFRELGGYDHTFAVNEDAEYDIRLSKSGGRILLEPSAVVWYTPRKDLKSLARQYFRYGCGRAATTLKHRVMPRPRQLIPVLALVANLICGLVAPFAPVALVLPATYFAALALASFQSSDGKFPDRISRSLASAAALVTMHMSWGLGFACKVAKSWTS